MTDEQMIKEIIERRRQWGETRHSDFDWIMNHIKFQQKEIEKLKKDIKDMMTGYEDWDTNFVDEN